MAYALKKGGSDWETVLLRDVFAQQELPDDTLEWVKFSALSWTKDNSGFFYSRFDAPNSLSNATFKSKAGVETDRVKNHKVYYHRLGTKQEQDNLVFQMRDQPDYLIAAHVSNCGNYLLFIVENGSHAHHLLYIADLNE